VRDGLISTAEVDLWRIDDPIWYFCWFYY